MTLPKYAFQVHLDKQEVEALLCAAKLGVPMLPKSMWTDADTAMSAIEETFDRHVKIND